MATEPDRSSNNGQTWTAKLKAFLWQRWPARPVKWVSYVSLLFFVIIALTLVIAPRLIRPVFTQISPPIQQSTTTDQMTDFTRQLVQYAQSEYWASKADHISIALWVAHCLGAGDISDLPTPLTKYLSPWGSDEWRGVDTKIEKVPTTQQRGLVQLSQDLIRLRIANAGVVRNAQTNSELTQWIIVLLGLFTTIVISLSSTEYGKGETKGPKTLRLIAITLPALGTAVAAINGFYAPGVKASQADRTLGSLSQLHSQIAHEVWAIGCAEETTKPNWAVLDSKITTWIKRYQEIQTLATTAPSSEKGESPGGGSSGPGGAKK